jgi:hypothetical protein
MTELPIEFLLLLLLWLPVLPVLEVLLMPAAQG